MSFTYFAPAVKPFIASTTGAALLPPIMPTVLVLVTSPAKHPARKPHSGVFGRKFAMLGSKQSDPLIMTNRVSGNCGATETAVS